MLSRAQYSLVRHRHGSLLLWLDAFCLTVHTRDITPYTITFCLTVHTRDITPLTITNVLTVIVFDLFTVVSMYLSVRLSLCPCLSLSMYLSVRVSLLPPVCLSVCLSHLMPLSVCLSVCLSVGHLSVHQSLSLLLSVHPSEALSYIVSRVSVWWVLSLLSSPVILVRLGFQRHYKMLIGSVTYIRWPRDLDVTTSVKSDRSTTVSAATAVLGSEYCRVGLCHVTAVMQNV